MKWNKWGSRPPLCTHRLNWSRTTSWVWCDEWDDTALQTQDSKFEPWRSEAKYANSQHAARFQSRRYYVFFKTARRPVSTTTSSLRDFLTCSMFDHVLGVDENHITSYSVSTAFPRRSTRSYCVLSFCCGRTGNMAWCDGGNTAGHDYIRGFFIFYHQFTCQILNMLNINQQDLNSLTSLLSIDQYQY